MTPLEMSEEIDRLNEENKELRERLDRIGQHWDRLATWRHLMHQWLFQYGQHADFCKAAEPGKPCICGLCTALNPDYPNRAATKAA